MNWPTKGLIAALLDKSDFDYPEVLKVTWSMDRLPLNNNKCHVNAISAVKMGLAARVIEVVCIDRDSGSVIAHFINQMEDGTYIDYTLGWYSETDSIRFIRVVPEEEFWSPNRMLTKAKTRHARKVLKWWHTLLGINEYTVC